MESDSRSIRNVSGSECVTQKIYHINSSSTIPARYSLPSELILLVCLSSRLIFRLSESCIQNNINILPWQEKTKKLPLFPLLPP